MESKIKILILNFNGKAFLDNCIKSVNDINYGNYSVVVIDNNSTDGSVQYVKEKYPEIEIIETKSNLMFAGGYNYFFSQALDDCFYMILNNDTIVDKEILNDFMDGVNRYGENNIYGAKILYLKDKDKIWYAGAKVNLSKGVIKHLNIRRDNSNVKLKDCMTGYVTGCCLFAHSKIFKKLEGFDSSFKMYMEDVDFCLRAKKRGINSYFLNSPKLFHHVSGSVKNKFFKIICSYMRLSLKHTGFLSIFNTPLFIIRKFLFFK